QRYWPKPLTSWPGKDPGLPLARSPPNVERTSSKQQRCSKRQLTTIETSSMSEIAFGLVSAYGVVIILIATYLSCLAMPVPTSFVMLAGGGFAASGDLGLVSVVLAALAGAVMGDQSGFYIGR